MSAELDRWLDAATRGLPQETRSWVRAELQAHYEDAAREQQRRGEPPNSAHRRALAELGSASAISGDLRETHLAEQRYRFAAAASLIFPLTVLAHVTWVARGAPGMAIIPIDLLLLLPLLYVLRTLHTLLVLRFDLHIGRRLALIALGVAGITVPEILMDGYWIALTHGIGGEPSALGLRLLNALLLLDLLGTVALGIGFLWLALALLRLKAGSLWMLRPFCGAALISGGIFVLIGGASLVGWQAVFDPAWLGLLIVGVIMHALWTLLFLRAAQPSRAVFAL